MNSDGQMLSFYFDRERMTDETEKEIEIDV
jgi:hypothetical protein